MSKFMQLMALPIASAGFIAAAWATEPATGSAKQSMVTASSAQQLSPQQLEALRVDLKAYFGDDTKDLEVTQDQTGAEHIDLQGRNSNVILARRNADGSISQTCVNQAETAVQFLANDQQPVAEDR